MRSSDNQSSAPKPSYPYRTPVSSVLPSSLLHSSSFSTASDTSIEQPPTPDPSPNMSPQDPKSKARSAVTLPTPSSISKSAGTSTASLTPNPSSSSASSSSSLSLSSSSGPRPPHTLYSSATPPMSPAHTLLSPASNPYQATADSIQHSSGFYQLPPPLQAFRPHDVARQSPTMAPQQYQQSSQNGGSLLLPPPRSSQSAGYNGMSPRSNPQQSPRMHHPLSSPSIGPLSPYLTPQHHPQHQTSPHQSPRYESHHLQQPVPPNMALPESSLSSTSVFQASPLRSYPAPYPGGQATKSPASKGAQLKSPRTSVSQRSAPNSPQRFMMLPPQTAPAMASARQASAQSKLPGSTGTKRRESSNAKAVDQDAREMMRKVSHSAIERRRRERINDKILRLKLLVPACVDEDHLHKLSILQSTIEYIQYLKSVIPESVANAKFQKATNSNPNNKTTDMLDAVSSNQSNMTFSPMMTTGLDYPYSKKQKSDNPRHDSSRSGTSESTGDTQNSRRMSATKSSSDEDAKDGLLLLSLMSSGARSGNNSPNLAPERMTSKERDLVAAQDGKRRLSEEDYEEYHESLQEDSEVSDDLEDEDYREEDMMEESATTRRSSSNSGKMSVQQMLC